MTDAHNLYLKNRLKQCEYAIEDTFDGKAYQKLMVGDYLISVNFNVDGAWVFEISNTSAYPVLCTINELSSWDRRNPIMMSSVWFGTGEPKNMNAYLTPFVTESKKLLKDGFTYIFNGQTYKKSCHFDRCM